ncbi:hypothetical protein Tco_0827188 [Tanacetum coccineum]
MKVGTSNPEKRLGVTRKRETRIVPVSVPGYGMVGLGKVDDSMIVAIIPPPFPEINIDHCDGGLHVSIPRSIPSHRSSEVYIHRLFTVVFLRRPVVAFRFGRGSKLDAEWCFAWLMNTNELAYALSMPLLLSLLISIACDDGCRCSKSHKNRFRGCQCAKTQYRSRKATRTDLWDDTGKANKIRITLVAVLFLGIQNAGAVPPVVVSLKDEDSVHLIMTFSWFQDGQISYEEFEVI